jgi:hypothetical protein
MNPVKCLIVILLACFLFSCTTTKPFVSSVNPNELTDVQRFEPLSFIQLIEIGNSGQFNDSLSLLSKKLINETLDGYKEIVPISNAIAIDGFFEKIAVEEEIEFLCTATDKGSNLSIMKITPVIDSILDAREKRFGMLTFSTGFTRAKYNYGLQVFKSIFLGVFTLGMYVQTPVKASSTVYIMIVDAKDNNIAYFRKSFLHGSEPLKPKVIKNQIESIFKNYIDTEASDN